jgi:tetratricopeptide (TPR) repeat protein
MPAPATDAGDRLGRRLERFRNARTDPGVVGDPLPYRRGDPRALAERLASAVEGEILHTRLGLLVRVERPSVPLPLDRRRLGSLPGQPPAGPPLVCLDTETTGLATAAGTVAFLIGLGWWEGDRFRQAQLLLPDHPDEPALLEEVARHIPADAWLVTYNGRGFDWPLLVTRYRLARRPAPPHAGHLDLLPTVRRVFRHRMDDARLRTVERMLLGSIRHDDVDGWEIPGRYLGFLRGGPAQPLAAVVRHNDEDVRSLARLLAHLDVTLGDRVARARAPRGDLAGLARAFRREHRLAEAIECLDAALEAGPDAPAMPQPAAEAIATAMLGAAIAAGSAPPDDDDGWWSPRRPADFGGPPRARSSWLDRPTRRQAFDRPWDDARIAVDRAHLLRRLGRMTEALEAWDALACGPGRVAIVAAVEAAKLREHRLGDPAAAWTSSVRGLELAERRRRLGRPEPDLEADLRRRLRRLRLRLDRRAGRRPGPQLVGGTSGSLGSSDSEGQRPRTQSSAGSNEQAIVRRSPVKALR